VPAAEARPLRQTKQTCMSGKCVSFLCGHPSQHTNNSREQPSSSWRPIWKTAMVCATSSCSLWQSLHARAADCVNMMMWRELTHCGPQLCADASRAYPGRIVKQH
jgi:hypothetical protein